MLALSEVFLWFFSSRSVEPSEEQLPVLLLSLSFFAAAALFLRQLHSHSKSRSLAKLQVFWPRTELYTDFGPSKRLLSFFENIIRRTKDFILIFVGFKRWELIELSSMILNNILC